MTTSSAYICTLSETDQKRAEEELNEKVAWRLRDIDALRQMIRQCPGINSRLDDPFLLRFLRTKKFDYDRALRLLVNYYRVRADYPEIFTNFRPSAVRSILEAGIVNVLDKRDQAGRRVIVFRPGKWDLTNPNINSDQIFKALLITLEFILETEEETQLNGVIFIQEMSEITWQHFRRLSIAMFRRNLDVLQEAFPIRLKSMNVVQNPRIFTLVFNIIYPLLKEKMRSRVYLYLFLCQSYVFSVPVRVQVSLF
jgi:hypothetical protein